MSKKQKEESEKLLMMLEKKLHEEKRRRDKRRRRLNLAYRMRRKYIWTELERKRHEKLTLNAERLNHDSDALEHQFHGRCSIWEH